MSGSLSTKTIERAERYIAGMSMSEIAREDGVTAHGVRDSLRGVMGNAGQSAVPVPGSPLPKGCAWMQRGPSRRSHVPEWYVTTSISRPGMIWALAVLNLPGPAVCPGCGRPF